MDIISDLCTPIFANNDKHIEVWVRNENRHIINMLKRKYNFDEDNYEMVEFVMKRDRFNYQPIESELILFKYEPGHLDNYLVLLNEAMTYHRELYNYFDERDIYHNKFLKNNTQSSLLTPILLVSGTGLDSWLILLTFSKSSFWG